MAVDLTLGTVPKKLQVPLVSGADFSAGLRRSTGDYEAGTELTIEFDTGEEFVAVVVDDLATWLEDEVVVDALIAAKPKTAKLWYVNGALKILWAQGAVVIK